MKRVSLLLLFLMLSRLTASAATVRLSVGTTFSTGLNPSTGTTTSLFTANLGDRTGLTPGLPILVTFDIEPLFGGYDLVLQTPGATFRDTITISAVLGAAAANTSTVFVIPNAQDFSSWPAHSFPPFSFTVPWEADLSAVSISVNQVLSVDGSGNGITLAGGGSTVTMTTQSAPEPSAGILVVCTCLLVWRRRRASE